MVDIAPVFALFAKDGCVDAGLKDAFDVLYTEGETAPKMMSIGLHCRLIGRPSRFRALQRFLDYVVTHDQVWIARRIDIARHWATEHPCLVGS